MKTVVKNNLLTVGSIMLHLRGKTKSNCKINNPTGSCCEHEFSKVIEKALELKKNSYEVQKE